MALLGLKIGWEWAGGAWPAHAGWRTLPAAHALGGLLGLGLAAALAGLRRL